jgi:hypothetical protein
VSDPFWREPEEPRVVRFPPLTCSWCQTPVNATFASDVSTNLPTEGAVTICLACGMLSAFVFSGRGVPSLRPLSRQENAEFEHRNRVKLAYIREQIVAHMTDDE